MISLVEVPVAFLKEELKLDRTKAVLNTSGIIFIIGALTVHPKSLFGSVIVAGNGFFHLFDYIYSNILLPVGGLLIAILVGYFVKQSDLHNELSNKGKLKNEKIIKFYRIVLRYITPVLLILVFLNSVGILKIG